MGKLVLSRTEGEKVAIGSDIVITVVELSRGRCRLAIEAPRDLLILRLTAGGQREGTHKGTSEEASSAD